LKFLKPRWFSSIDEFYAAIDRREKKFTFPYLQIFSDIAVHTKRNCQVAAA